MDTSQPAVTPGGPGRSGGLVAGGTAPGPDPPDPGSHGVGNTAEQAQTTSTTPRPSEGGSLEESPVGADLSWRPETR